MVADLHRADTLIRHVAVGTGNAGPGVNPLIVHLEFRVLCLQDGRSTDLVSPVLVIVALGLVVRKNAVCGQALRPRICQPLLRAAEVILHVALAAHVSAHLLSGSVTVHVEVLHALRRLDRPDPFHERRTRHTKGHRLGIVAVDA